MPQRKWIMSVLSLCVIFALCGCGKDFNGFGESAGWGGYTKQYGDVDEGYRSVGLCSYTGGCTPPGVIAAPKSEDAPEP